MSRLYNLQHVAERARSVGIRPEWLHTKRPTVALHPCPVCGDHDAYGQPGLRFTALAVWDDFAVLMVCNGCGGEAVADALLADLAPPTWHLSRLIPTDDELARWRDVVDRRLQDPIPDHPSRAQAVAS